jgi:polygalacturonase
MSFTLVPVTRTYLDEDDQPRSGTVRLQLTGVLHNDGAFAGRNVHAVSLDAAGTASLLVPATNDPGTLPETGGTYQVTEALSDLPTTTYYIEVPFDGGPVDLATAPRLTEPAAPGFFYQPVNERNLPNGYAGLDGSGRVSYDQLPTDIGDGGGGGGSTPISGDDTDIQALGTRAAGASGKAADARHVHEMPALHQVRKPTTAVDANGQKFTNLANGVNPQDAATVAQLGQSVLGWINVKDPAYGATGDGETDDTAALQAALDACPPGGIVYLPQGVYRTSAPLTPHPGRTMRGARSNLMAGIDLTDPPCYIQPLPSFTGSALIVLKDQASGGYAALSAEHHIEDLMLDGSTLDGTKPVDGLFAEGNIQNVRLSSVTIRRMSNNGIVTGGKDNVFPYSWRMTNVMVDNCRANGLLFTRMTDLTMIDCQVIGCWGRGAVLSNVPNSQLVGCRFEWNGSHGVHITGAWGNGTGSGGMQLTACGTDRNGGDGILVDATGNGPISIVNLTARRDGRNGGNGGNNHAGLSIVGATVPVIASTVTCYPGLDDDGTGTNSPQYGIRVSGSTSVQLDHLNLHAAQKGLHDDGTNQAVIIGPVVTVASGPTTAPVRHVRQTGVDWINVRTHGARGDGITDDTAALQAAVNAAAAAKTAVYIPTGTFIVSAPITLPAGEGYSIFGSGWGSSVKLKAASNCYVFKMTAADTRVTMRDLTIDGNVLEQGTTGASGGIDGSGAVACRFDNVHFIACRDNGLYLGGMTGGAFGHNNRIIGCLFDQSMTSTGPGRGIHLDSSDENQIIGCDFEYLGGSGGSGATAASMIFDQAGTQFIVNCNFVNGGNNAIGVRVQDAKSTKVIACNFDGLAGTAIFLAAQRCVISSNTIFSVGHAGTAGQASGIHLDYATADNIVEDNVITSDPVNGVSRGAIREASDGGSGRNSIRNNQIITDGTWSYGALDLSGTGSWVRGNIGGGPLGQGRAMPGVLFVAASDAPAADNLVADYVCDGTADNVEIQAAIDAAKTGGGQVRLSKGTFQLAAQLRLEGADDVDVEVDVTLRGAGQRLTTLNVAGGVASGLHLTKVIRAHLADFGVAIGGASHGISSDSTHTAASAHRSFWHSSFKNLQINGPWDGTHTGWGMNLGSPFRSVFENIEMGGIGNGLRLFSENDAFNPGDCQFTRMFIDTHGDNRVAYQAESATATGVMNQIEFSMCEAIASGTGCTGILLGGVGAVTHTHWRGINLEQFDKLVDIQNGYGNTFRLNYVQLRSAAGLTGFTFAPASYNNAILSCGLFYTDASALLFADGNTALPSQPNSVERVRIYADGTAAITGTPNGAGTTVRRQIVGSGTGTISVLHPIGANAPSQVITLTDGATVTPDASRGSHFRWNMAGDRTLAAPTNPTDGQTLVVEHTASGADRTLAVGAGVVFGSDITAVTTTLSGKTDILTLMYHAPSTSWRVVNYRKGF